MTEQRKVFMVFLEVREGPAGSLHENREHFVFSSLFFYFKPTKAHWKECKLYCMFRYTFKVKCPVSGAKSTFSFVQNTILQHFIRLDVVRIAAFQKLNV